MAIVFPWIGRISLVVLALVLIFWGNTAPPPPPPPPPPPCGNISNQKDITPGGGAVGDPILTIMARIDCGEIKKESEETANDESLRMAGDICLMRYPRLLPGVSRDLRQKFAAAVIASQDGGIEILHEIEATSSGLIEWRAAVEIARIAERAGSREMALAALARARSVPEVPVACQSDMDLIAGRLALDDEVAVAYFDSAVAADPGNFAAHVERALGGATLRVTTPQTCVASVERIMESVVYLESLTQSSSQLLRIKSRAAILDENAPQRALLDGFVFERIGRKGEAADIYRKAIARIQSGLCGERLRLAFEIRLDRVMPK